jgi:putative mycofactocin binding protein MftB
MLELSAVLRLSPSVALRPEPFGAMAYHFGNRKLTFLKRPELVQVVSALNGVDSLEQVLTSCEIPATQWQTYLKALTALQESDMIHSVDWDEPRDSNNPSDSKEIHNV